MLELIFFFVVPALVIGTLIIKAFLVMEGYIPKYYVNDTIKNWIPTRIEED